MTIEQNKKIEREIFQSIDRVMTEIQIHQLSFVLNGATGFWLGVVYPVHGLLCEYRFQMKHRTQQ